MAKAVFIDYAGALLNRRSRDLEEFANRILKSSRMSDADALADWWLRNRGLLEQACNTDGFMTEEDICVNLLHRMEKEFGLRENVDELKQLIMNHWVYAPIFSDVREFFEDCGLPIYVVTNNNEQYVRVCLRRNGLHVNGVISGETLKAYKPDHRVFARALEVSECEGPDVLFIGSSLTADIPGATECGMRVLLLDRYRRAGACDCKVIYKLSEAHRYL